jgi:hypothetical protein
MGKANGPRRKAQGRGPKLGSWEVGGKGLKEKGERQKKIIAKAGSL